MKKLLFVTMILLLFPALVLGGEKEGIYLKETMLPLAREFLQRIGVTNNLPRSTNQVAKFRVDYFDDRPGCMADMRLTNSYIFGFHTETNRSEVWSFRRGGIKTYYDLKNPPKEKIDALKAMNRQNKLNKEKALLLATKYLNLIGHDEQNFHPPEISQGYWVSSPQSPPSNDRRLPFYEIIWYRNDVKKEDLGSGNSTALLTSVTIEVSGIDLGVVSYSKGLLPMNGDF